MANLSVGFPFYWSDKNETEAFLRLLARAVFAFTVQVRKSDYFFTKITTALSVPTSDQNGHTGIELLSCNHVS